MRFLVDESLSWRLAELLAAEGHDALHVRDLGMISADDRAILDRAISENRVVLTQDTDFGTLLASGAPARASVVLFRLADGRMETQFHLLRSLLSDLAQALSDGSIVVITDAHVRIRRLS